MKCCITHLLISDTDDEAVVFQNAPDSENYRNAPEVMTKNIDAFRKFLKDRNCPTWGDQIKIDVKETAKKVGLDPDLADFRMAECGELMETCKVVMFEMSPEDKIAPIWTKGIGKYNYSGGKSHKEIYLDKTVRNTYSALMTRCIWIEYVFAEMNAIDLEIPPIFFFFDKESFMDVARKFSNDPEKLLAKLKLGKWSNDSVIELFYL